MLAHRRLFLLARATGVAGACVVAALTLGTLPAVAAGPTAHDVAGTETEHPAESDRLRSEAEARSAEVQRDRTALDAATTAAQDALERYTLAVRTLQTAQTAENTARDRLRAAQLELTAQRDELGHWARTAYRNGRSFEAGLGMATLLEADTTDELAMTAGVLRQIGRNQSSVVEDVTAAEAEAEAATEQAGLAAAAAEAAAVAATAEKAKADTAVRAQQQELDRSQRALAEAEDAASAAATREQQLAAAAGVARAGGNVVSGAVGSCTGGDVGMYPNGQIPLAALCPLASASGHHLRADAAHAFDRMSAAFAARFGTGICVTDSYRSYSEQVRLKRVKPTLAATPGTSNHGWGTATDLCGGIQSFSSAQHAWMLGNAPAYGWFHPSWARAGGSKPEPWHWEFAG